MNESVRSESGEAPGKVSPNERLARRIRRGIRFIVAAAITWIVALLIAAVVFGDGTMVSRVATAGWSIGGLTATAFVLNHLLRFARWQSMLYRLGAFVPLLASLKIFMSGLALLPTPGKAGVAVRSVLLEYYRVPVGTSLSMYFAERLFDFVGLLILAVAFYQGPMAEKVVGVGLAVVVSTILVVRHFAVVALTMRRLVGWRPKYLSVIDAMENLVRGIGRFLALRWFVQYIALGMLANIVVGLLLWAVVGQFSGKMSAAAGIGAIAAAHLVGSASMAPGGFGPFELTLNFELRLADVQQSDVLIAVSSVRMVTLWGPVIIGLPLLVAQLKNTPLDTQRW
jgi:glycosyltransferase 2 family protein